MTKTIGTTELGIVIGDLNYGYKILEYREEDGVNELVP